MKLLLSENAKGGFLVSMCLGIAVGYITVFAMLAVSALLLTVADLPDGSAVIMSTVCLSVASLVCGLLASKKLGSHALIIGVLSGFVFYASIAVISSIITKGEFTSLFILRLILASAMSGVGSVLGVFKKSDKSVI